MIKVIAISFLLTYHLLHCSGMAADLNSLPARGRVTMIGFGVSLCIPCMELDQTINKLQKLYGEKVDLKYVDIWKQPDVAKKFNVELVPTQMFFNKKGILVYRHEDEMSEKAIILMIKKLTTE